MTECNGKEFALFLGCTIPLRFPFIESASKKVLNALNIKIKELPFGCCPDPNGVQSFNRETWFSLATRNLCLAEEEELDILTFCNGCYETLKVVNSELQNSEELRKKINKNLAEVGREYKGTTHVRHIIQELHNRRRQISNLVTRPLDKYRFAVHYGCHILRPSGILQMDDPEHPVILDELVEALKGNSIPYPKKGMCCGAGVYTSDLSTSIKIIREKFIEINKAQANAIVVCCPTCYNMYESGQALIKRDCKEIYGFNGTGIPIIYYTELLAFALDIDISEEFKQHRNKLFF
ncbi:MAG: CoB--CoM heterodisulfide reductase iron-sulfur subunit B family protein [Candidatus Hodarchaeota archaeon]